MSAPREHVEKDRPPCIVMSPTDSRLLDVVVEIATTQLRNGRHFMRITRTDSSLNYNGSLKALRPNRGVHTVVSDGCAFGFRCVVTEHLVAAGWQFVTTLPQLVRKMQRRCTGGHVHVQRTPDQQMPVRMRRGIVTSIRQTRGRLETAQSVAAVEDMWGKEESGDILGRPHSWVQPSLRRLHVNPDHPTKKKTTSCCVISGTYSRRNEPWKLQETSNALLAKLPNIPVRHDNPPRLKSGLL